MSNNGTVTPNGFTIGNGQATGMARLIGTHAFNLKMPGNAAFAVDTITNTVTETLTGPTEALQFLPNPANASFFHLAAETVSFVRQGSATTPLSVDPVERARFFVNAGENVMQVQHVQPDGTVTTVAPNANVIFSQLASGYILETVTTGTHSSFELYHDGNGDGIYTAIAHGGGTTVDLVGVQAQLSATINAVI